MVLAFVSTDVPEAAGLVAQLQNLVKENKGLHAFVVFQGGVELKDEILSLAAKKDISLPMAYMMNGKKDAGLKLYKINPEAKNTILVNNQRKVLANFVNVAPDQFQPVAMAAKKMLASAE